MARQFDFLVEADRLISVDRANVLMVLKSPSAMKIGYVRVSTIEQNLAWPSRSAAQADVQQSQEIDRKSP